MVRKRFCKLSTIAAVLMVAALPTVAQAQFPDRNITLIVPYGAGGGTDITARLLARDMEAVLGKPVTVENRAGGGGWVGWGGLAAARPDGYTLGYLNVPSMYAGYLDKSIGRKETLDSFTPLMNHVLDYNVWAVKADSPYKSVKDVVEAARKAAERRHRHGLWRGQRRSPRDPVDGAGEQDQALASCIRARRRRRRRRHWAATSTCSAPTSRKLRRRRRAACCAFSA